MFGITPTSDVPLEKPKPDEGASNCNSSSVHIKIVLTPLLDIKKGFFSLRVFDTTLSADTTIEIGVVPRR